MKASHIVTSHVTVHCLVLVDLVEVEQSHTSTDKLNTFRLSFYRKRKKKQTKLQFTFNYNKHKRFFVYYINNCLLANETIPTQPLLVSYHSSGCSTPFLSITLPYSASSPVATTAKAVFALS
uniref:Uncharacterized protein n=1 Tax=Amphimedon queenslandica TaxID=400682 RepID=A0A1X7V6U2_AMPQE